MLWDSYYARYWGLKNDQFDFWLFGVLDHDTFFDWSCSTALAFRDEAKLQPARQRLLISWKKWREKDQGAANPAFVQFTDSIITAAQSCQIGDHIVREVIDEISRLEGTKRKPGTSRWRKLIWRNQSWEEFRNLIEPDLAEKRRHRQNGNGSF